MQAFRDLKVWNKAHEFTLDVYKQSAAFPRDEIYGLTSQLRRSAMSIAANIAEGCGRNGSNELRHFLEIAMGSASEVEYHLLLARDLGFLRNENHATLDDRICEIKRMLSALIKKLSVK